MVQRGRDFVRRRTGQELLHTKSPRLRLLRLHGLLRSSLFLIFRLFTSFLLDDRLQAAGDAVDFAVSAFVGSEIDILVHGRRWGAGGCTGSPSCSVPAKRQPLNRFLFQSTFWMLINCPNIFWDHRRIRYNNRPKPARRYP